MAPTYRATFTDDPRSVVLARTAVGKFARLCGFSEREVADIRAAVGEALIGASQHASTPHGGGFTVTCRCESGELRVEIQDSGGDEEERTTSRFGTIIMRTLMNSVEYSRGGSRVCLVKRLEE